MFLLKMAVEELIPPTERKDNDGLYPKKENEQPKAEGDWMTNKV